MENQGSFLSVHAQNYRLFKDVNFDFSEKTSQSKNVVLIYGENGAGKTALSFVFSLLKGSLETFLEIEKIMRIASMHPSKDPKDTTDNLAYRYGSIINIPSLIAGDKRIGSGANPMALTYCFLLNGKLGTYSFSFSEDQVIAEKLSYQVRERSIDVFNFTSNHKKDDDCLNPTVFKSKEARDKLLSEADRLFGNQTFLSIAANFLRLSAPDYVSSAFDPSLEAVIDFFNSVVVMANRNTFIADSRQEGPCLREPFEGDYDDSEEPLLRKNEVALSQFFSLLYSRIVSVFYKRDVSGGRKTYQLYFRERNPDGDIIKVPNEDESNGTRRLVSLFYYLYSAVEGRVVVIDEIDTGIHDVLMSDILKSVLEDVKGQLIITTHNTLLMKDVKPKQIYLLNFEKNGVETFFSLDAFGNRIQKTTDVVGRYLKGLYGGVPYTSGLSMSTIQYLLDKPDEK